MTFYKVIFRKEFEMFLARRGLDKSFIKDFGHRRKNGDILYNGIIFDKKLVV